MSAGPTAFVELRIEQGQGCRRLPGQRWRLQQPSQLRLGAGRHCGALLSEVDDGYLASLLAKIPDLPDPVRAIFSERTGDSALLAG